MKDAYRKDCGTCKHGIFSDHFLRCKIIIREAEVRKWREGALFDEEGFPIKVQGPCPKWVDGAKD